ncbi:putative deoxyribonuclease TATDN1, partial [Cimex lectularius]|uniref:Deoxyribonuclease TATDN1 n=1 Tax=Cimex lectularius TaxID=79782 RepID=A0A8I6TG45_CIMLE
MSLYKFIDIGANLTDLMYQGIYNGSKKHQPDLTNVLKRGWDNGLDKIIITGTYLEDCKEALELAKTDERLYLTIGCHPTRSNEFEKSGDPDKYLQDLSDLINEARPKVVALGECGLDYDRLNFSGKELQLKYFEKQLELCKNVKLPLFLHCRNAFDDVHSLLNKHKPLFGGVVHSFDGTAEQADAFIKQGFHIGVNGCSLKTEDNLKAVREIPSDRLMIETDSPWCDVRPTHAGFKYVQTQFNSTKKEKWKSDCMVKSRNEPANIVQILEIVSGVKGENKEKLCDQIYKNTLNMF